jgi:DNA-binding NarL/FixJ family response regulator
MRYGLAHLIRTEDDLDVAGEAGTAAEALSTLPQVKPDLVILDLSLPDRNGLELIKDLCVLLPRTGILVVSMHDETLFAERALRAGARGYVMKEEAAEKLVAAIRSVLAGRVFVSQAVSSRVLDALTRARDPAPASSIERLTDRELEVFQLIGQGASGREIAAKLRISIRTVDAHRAHIREKLGLRDGTDLIRQAVCWTETGRLAESQNL